MDQRTNGQQGSGSQPRRARIDRSQIPDIGPTAPRGGGAGTHTRTSGQPTGDAFGGEPQRPQAVDPFRPVAQQPTQQQARSRAAAPVRRANPNGNGFDVGAVMPKSIQNARKTGPGRAALIAIGVLIAIVLVAYIGVSVYFHDRFMPHTTVGDIDLSLMTSKDAEQTLSDAIGSYGLAIEGEGFTLDLTSSDAGVSIDAPAVVDAMLSDVNPWAWPIGLIGAHDETDRLVATLNGTGLEDAVRAAVAAFNETAEQPTNASIAYDEATGAFAVTPDQVGTALDADKVLALADEAVAALEPTVKLTPDVLVQPTLFANDPVLATAVSTANTMITADLSLTMAGTAAGEVDKSLISQWIYLDENHAAALDGGALAQWVSSLAAKLNTVGGTRSYTREDGKAITVSGGSYGWEIDEAGLQTAIHDGIMAGTVGEIAIPCTIEGTGYKPGARDWGNRYADVDLSEQYARLYDDSGTVIWESSIISGDPTPGEDRETPTGVWYLNNKESPSTLNTYEKGKDEPNKTKVEYWMPFQGNLVGFHDAWWQPGFGGTMYKDGYGSHGCVNLPSDKAEELYGLINKGDVVVVHW